jgi:manganese/zinc/iron transport system ATP- binding protein
MTNIVMKINNLSVAYDRKNVLNSITIDIPSSKLISIIGPNGAGKSTFLKSIIGLIDAKYDKISFFGNSYKDFRKKIAYVPQRSSIDWDFPTNVFDTVLMGTYGKLGWFKKPGKLEKQKTYEVLEKLEITDLKKRQIGKLSGGQQQRVFIARALLQEAEIFLMDEPFQGVDATTEIKIINILKELRDNGKTVLCVHHDLTTVEDYFDYVMFLNKRIIDFGVTKDVFNNENLKKTYTTI